MSSVDHNPPTATQCPQCSESVNELKFLSCCHTFCSKCLKIVVESSQREKLVPCPICGTKTAPIEQDPSELPCNYIVQSFLDSRTRTGKEEKTVPCDQCNQDEIATHHCRQCKENMCMVHSEGHRRGKSTNTHELDKLMNNNECPVHKGEELQLLCNDCNSMLICRDCAIREHKNHDYKFICDVINEKRKEHNILLDKVASFMRKVEGDMENIEKMIESLRDKREKEINNIKKSSETLINAILKKTTILENEVNTLCTSRIGKLERKKQGLSNLLYTLRHSDGKLADSYNDIEFVTIERYTRQQLKKLQEKAVKYVNPTADTLFEAKTDTELLQNILENSWLLLNYKNDRTRVLNAVKQDGSLLKYVSNELKNDREVALAAVKNNAIAFQYCPNELKNNKDFVLCAIKVNRDALEYVSEELKNDKEIQTILETKNDTCSRASKVDVFKILNNSEAPMGTFGVSFGSTTNISSFSFSFTDPRNDNVNPYPPRSELNPLKAETSSRDIAFNFPSRNTGFDTFSASGSVGEAGSLLSGGIGISTTGGLDGVVAATQRGFGGLSDTSTMHTFATRQTTEAGRFGGFGIDAGLMGRGAFDTSGASIQNFPKFVPVQEDGFSQDGKTPILKYQSIARMKEYENYSFEEVRYEYWKASKSLPTAITFNSDTKSSFGSEAPVTNTGFGFGPSNPGFGAEAKISSCFGGFNTGTTGTGVFNDTAGTRLFGRRLESSVFGFSSETDNKKTFSFASNLGCHGSGTAGTSSNCFGFNPKRFDPVTTDTANSVPGVSDPNPGVLDSKSADNNSSGSGGFSFTSQRLDSKTTGTSTENSDTSGDSGL